MATISAFERQYYRPDACQWYDDLPAPASPAVRVGDLLFIAGQVSLNSTFDVVDAGDVEAQARRAFEQIGEIVETAGGTLRDIVEVMSFHADPREIDTVLEVAREYFTDDYPAWTPVAMSGSYKPGVFDSCPCASSSGRWRKGVLRTRHAKMDAGVSHITGLQKR